MKGMYYIEWIDSVSDGSWRFDEGIDNKCEKVETLGFLVKEDDSCVTIALNHGKVNEQFSCLMTIPKCCIKLIKPIKEILYENL